MSKSSAVIALAGALLCACGEESPQRVAGAGMPVPSDFTRFVEVGEGGRLETNAVTYGGPDGQQVVLIGTVHIADAAYYEQLNEMFRGYDALLYELVADQDDRPTPGEPRGGLLSMLQRGMCNAFELQFQLDGIDYGAANFVHADLDPQSFARMQAERGESLLSLMWNAMKQQFATMQGGGEGAAANLKPFDLVSAFRNRQGRHTMRMMFAAQLEDMEKLAAGFGGENGSVLLEGRNERALEVLREQLDAGKKKLAIYYGAAHMPHLEKRLVEDMGFAKTDEQWLLAWDVTPREDPVRKRREK